MLNGSIITRKRKGLHISNIMEVSYCEFSMCHLCRNIFKNACSSRIQPIKLTQPSYQDTKIVPFHGDVFIRGT